MQNCVCVHFSGKVLLDSQKEYILPLTFYPKRVKNHCSKKWPSLAFFLTFLNIRIKPLSSKPAAQSSSKQQGHRDIQTSKHPAWEISTGGWWRWLCSHLQKPFKFKYSFQCGWAVLVFPARSCPAFMFPSCTLCSCPSPLRQPLRAAMQCFSFKWPSKGPFSKLYLGNISRLGIRTIAKTSSQNKIRFFCGPVRIWTGSRLILFCLALFPSPRLQKHFVNQKWKHCSLVITEECLSWTAAVGMNSSTEKKAKQNLRHWQQLFIFYSV